MSAASVPGAWDTTYGRATLSGNEWQDDVSITTAITDHLRLVSDLEIKVRSPDGRASASAEITLSAQQMRDLAAMLQTAAARVDELEHMREQMVEQRKAEQAREAA